MKEKGQPFLNNRGFTIVELMIALAIAGIVMGAIFVTQRSQQEAYITQEQKAHVQQNVRYALYDMERRIRMAGCDPTESGQPRLQVIGPTVIQFTMDLSDGAGGDSDGDTNDDNEDITYALADNDGDGDLDLVRIDPNDPVNPGAQLVAQNVEGLGFAYAFDSGDLDEELDFLDLNGDCAMDLNEPVIWAVDTDGDGDLDLNLDINGDGLIDENDDTNGDNQISAADGGMAHPVDCAGNAILDVNMDRVRAVRVWVLAREERRAEKYADMTTYVVGSTLMRPAGNNRAFRHYLVTTTIRPRNLGL